MRKVLRAIAGLLITLVGIAVLVIIGRHVSSNDYVEYWSSGQLLVHGANPYAGPSILALEKSQGFSAGSPLIMLNPPWSLFMVAPLGFCSPLIGLILWIAIAAGCVLASLVVLGIPPKHRTIAFLFTPVLATFSMQQSSPLMLLGFALFLRFHRSRPFLAGASLLLMAIKPHLFLVFWMVLLADCVYRRSVRILAGFASSLACSSLFSTLLVPHVWQDYFALMRGSGLDKDYFPTLPTMVRVLIDVRLAWLALIPSVLAIIWGVAYYWSKRSCWDWGRNGRSVMLVTVLTSPYGWLSDQIVLLPAVTSTLESSPRRFSMEILTAINFAALFAFCMRSQLCMWIPLAWFVWYLYAARTAVDSYHAGLEWQGHPQSAMPTFSSEDGTD